MSNQTNIHTRIFPVYVCVCMYICICPPIHTFFSTFIHPHSTFLIFSRFLSRPDPTAFPKALPHTILPSHISPRERMTPKPKTLRPSTENNCVEGEIPVKLIYTYINIFFSTTVLMAEARDRTDPPTHATETFVCHVHSRGLISSPVATFSFHALP